MTDAGIDTGDILLQQAVEIRPEETAGELTLRLAKAGAELLLDTLTRLMEGQLQAKIQNEAEMSYFPLLRKEHGFIQWEKPANEIVNLIRGVHPWPGAASESPWGIMKILAATAIPDHSGRKPGEILRADSKQGLLIQAGDGYLEVLAVQAPGGKPMGSKDFLRGHPYSGQGAMNNIEVKP